MFDHQLATDQVTPAQAARSGSTRDRICKRALDLTLGSLALALVLPLMLVVAVGIRVLSGPPVLLRQTRVGRRGETFELLKFRTMRADASDGLHRAYVRNWIAGKPAAGKDGNSEVFKLQDDSRITPIGKWLRRFSLDELPQLFNVLRGDMSLVGPRPALPYEVELYTDRHRRRLETLPGITGLWQVSGRNRLGFEQMVKLDLEYLERWSLGRDLWILARTAAAVLSGGGH